MVVGAGHNLVHRTPENLLVLLEWAVPVVLDIEGDDGVKLKQRLVWSLREVTPHTPHQVGHMQDSQGQILAVCSTSNRVTSIFEVHLCC